MRISGRFILSLALILCAVFPSFSLAEAETETLVLSFAGDCTLGSTNRQQTYASGFVETMREKGFAYPFSGVNHILSADDLTLVNLEGTFTNSTKAADKAFVFRAPPEYAAILPFGSVEAVNIANNHIRDFFEEGRQDTIAALQANGVSYSGDGILSILDIKGVRIGLTGYSYPHRKTLEKLEEADLPLLKAAGCDIIIFSMHAGTEEVYKAGKEQREIARGAIDLGVDIVVGHHPHVLQGVEVYEGRPIFYSLGNFSFGGNINPKDWDTMIGQVIVEKQGSAITFKEMRLIPCMISGEERWSDYRPVEAQGEDAERVLNLVARYSPDADPDQIRSGVIPLEDGV